MALVVVSLLLISHVHTSSTMRRGQCKKRGEIGLHVAIAVRNATALAMIP